MKNRGIAILVALVLILGSIRVVGAQDMLTVSVSGPTSAEPGTTITLKALTSALENLESVKKLSWTDVWRLNGAELGSGTSSISGTGDEKKIQNVLEYTIPAGTTGNLVFEYSIQVSWEKGGKTSQYSCTGSFTVSVGAQAVAPTVAVSPSNQTITYGESVTFNAEATGDPAPTTQWQVSTDEGTSWSVIAGATEATLTLAKPLVADSGKQYRAVFTNKAGSAVTQAAVLTVNKATPIITWSNPSDIVYGTVLGYDQLNATANVAGSFVYNPFNGNILDAGLGQTLGVEFTPTDTANHTTANKTVSITVTQKPLTVTAIADNKTYDGTTAATGTIQLEGIVNEDAVAATGTFAFADKDAGNGKTVNVTGISLSGARAGNYTISGTASTIADIIKKNLKVTAKAADINHGETPQVTVEYEGLVTGESEKVLDSTEFALGTTYAPGKTPVMPVGIYETTIALGNATDNNYNYYPLVASEFEVRDVTPPAPPTITLTTDGWTNKNVTVTIATGQDEEGGSGVDKTEYRTKLGDAAWSEWKTYTEPFNIEAEGQTVVEAQTFDKAGNISVVARKTVKIDRTKPDTTATISPLGPDGQNGWYVSDVTIKLTASDDLASGVAKTQYSYNGTDWVDYSGSMKYSTDGAYTLYYRSEDNAGNIEDAKQISFKIDKTAPSAPTITLYPAAEWTNEDKVIVTVTPGTDGTSGVDKTEYRTKLGDAAWSDWKTYTGTFNITAEGQTVVEAKTFDKAGNISGEASETVKIDRTKPKIVITGNLQPGTYEDGDEIKMGYIGKGFELVIPYTKTDNDDASGFDDDANDTVTINTDEDGMGLTQSLTVTDRAGNSATITFQYNVISLDDLAQMLKPLEDGGTYNKNRTIPVKIQVLDGDGNPVALSSDDITLELKLFDNNGNEVVFNRTNKKKDDLGFAQFELKNEGVPGSYFQYNMDVKDNKNIKSGQYCLEIYMATEAMGNEPFKIGEVKFSFR